jgi:hypothetical protein
MIVSTDTTTTSSDVTSVLTPTEEELRTSAIDMLDEFDGDSPVFMENIDFA